MSFNKMDGDRYFDAEYDDSMERLNPLIDKFFDLYIMRKNRYHILDQRGDYNAVIWHKYFKSLNKKGAKPLMRFMVEHHLRYWYTLCVLASEYQTKFICFDVDITGNNKKKKAQKAVRLLFKTLVEYGIPKERIYISWSGKKGYHVEIFFKPALNNALAKEFFDLIVNRPGLNDIYDGKIEFLPTSSRAIKLPLGLNYSNRRKKDRLCCFVDIHRNEEFSNISYEQYFLDIQKVDSSVVSDALKAHIDSNGSIDHNLSNRNSLTRISSSTVKHINEEKQEHDSPAIQNKPEPNSIDMSISSLLRLEREGLKKTGTRHYSLLGLAIFYKDHYNYSREETEEKLIEWLSKQDKSTYTTSPEASIKDLKQVVKDVFEQNYRLGKRDPTINIFGIEVEEILKVKQKNAKLLLFALLAHNKKYSVLNNVFYMSYEQMSNSTKLSERTCISKMKNLVDQNFVEVVENKIYDRDKYYKPNKYKLLFQGSLKAKSEDQLFITFDYHNEDNIRKHFIQGIDLLDKKVISKHLTKEDFYLYNRGIYYKV